MSSLDGIKFLYELFGVSFVWRTTGVVRLLKGMDKMREKTPERGALAPSAWVPQLLQMDPENMSGSLTSICICLLAQFLGWRAESIMSIKMQEVQASENKIVVNASKIKCG